MLGIRNIPGARSVSQLPGAMPRTLILTLVGSSTNSARNAMIQISPPIFANTGASSGSSSAIATSSSHASSTAPISSSSAAPSATVSSFPAYPNDDSKSYTIGAYTYNVTCSHDLANGYDLATCTGVSTLQQCANLCEQCNVQQPTGTQYIAATKGNTVKSDDQDKCWLKY